MSRKQSWKPVVGKIEAATRQLDTAVWLWFNDGDIVSIHSLAGNAFGVIHDLFHLRYQERPMPFVQPPDGVNERDWRNMLKATETFAKHARNDAEDVHAYFPLFTMSYLFYAIVGLMALSGDGSYESHGLRSLFVSFFELEHPEFRTPFAHVTDQLFEFKPAKKRLSRAEFFKKFGGEFRGHPPRPDT